MSEYTPITGELRAAMRQWGWFESDGSITFSSASMPPSIDAEKALAIRGSDFDRLCDAIDAVHAQLERENAALKAELDRVLGEQEDSRGCIYYDPERHYCSCHDIDTDGLIELPRDENGKHIRIGDVMEWPTTYETFEVVGIGDGVLFYVEDGNEKADWTGAITKRHHAPDTWERIIEDAIGEGMARQRNNDSGNFCERANPMNNVDLVARCKALCERTKEAGE